MEIILDAGVDLLKIFADKINTTIDSNGKVIIPEQFGNGYLQGFIFSKNLRMMIQNFELKEDLIVKRTLAQNDTEKVTITFHNFFLSNTEYYDSSFNTNKLQSIQVFSGKLETEKVFSSKTLFKSITIGIEITYLKELLKGDYENTILDTITGKNKSFLFEELLPASIQKVLHEMLSNPIPGNLNNFYHKVKAEELICLLIAELLKRENAAMSSLNIDDVQTIYKIRDGMLQQLDIAPNLDELAAITNFSKSKLKRLFKQIFGTSIFHYYQSFRMKEAASLLREHKLSVSEVGFRMGFSNLSHFTRVFEEHIGMKPKKYSMEV